MVKKVSVKSLINYIRACVSSGRPEKAQTLSVCLCIKCQHCVRSDRRAQKLNKTSLLLTSPSWSNPPSHYERCCWLNSCIHIHYWCQSDWVEGQVWKSQDNENRFFWWAILFSSSNQNRFSRGSFSFLRSNLGRASGCAKGAFLICPVVPFHFQLIYEQSWLELDTIIRASRAGSHSCWWSPTLAPSSDLIRPLPTLWFLPPVPYWRFILFFFPPWLTPGGKERERELIRPGTEQSPPHLWPDPSQDRLPTLKAITAWSPAKVERPDWTNDDLRVSKIQGKRFFKIMENNKFVQSVPNTGSQSPSLSGVLVCVADSNLFHIKTTLQPNLRSKGHHF